MRIIHEIRVNPPNPCYPRLIGASLREQVNDGDAEVTDTLAIPLDEIEGGGAQGRAGRTSTRSPAPCTCASTSAPRPCLRSGRAVAALARPSHHRGRRDCDQGATVSLPGEEPGAGPGATGRPVRRGRLFPRNGGQRSRAVPPRRNASPTKRSAAHRNRCKGGRVSDE